MKKNNNKKPGLVKSLALFGLVAAGLMVVKNVTDKMFEDKENK